MTGDNDNVDDLLLRQLMSREIGDAMNRVLDRIEDPVLLAKMAGQAAECAIAATIAHSEPVLDMPRTKADCIGLVRAIMAVLTDQALAAIVPAMMKKYGIRE